MARGRRASNAEEPGESHGGDELDSDGLLAARERAIDFARTGADDETIEQALRALYCTGRGGPKGALRASQLAISFSRWVKQGLLRDARALGKLEVEESLHVSATAGEPKERASAATFLARRYDDPVGPDLRELLRVLKDMEPRQLVAHVEGLAAVTGGE